MNHGSDQSVHVHRGVAELLRFIRAHGGECLSKLDDSGVLNYLALRSSQKCLIMAKAFGQFVGMMDAKQCTEENIRDPWGADDPDGDCLVFGNFIVHPEFGVEVRRALVAQMVLRWPAWRELKLYMYRSKYGGLVRVKPRYVELAVRRMHHEL